MRTLRPEPLTAERFAPFGDVIERDKQKTIRVNGAKFLRWQDLARVDCGGRVKVDIMQCVTPTPLPARVSVLERHPKGSQAFMPLSDEPYVIAVAPPGDSPDLEQLRAFACTSSQGFNMRPGVWHLPLIGSRPGQSFLVIDRNDATNCDEIELTEPLMLESYSWA